MYEYVLLAVPHSPLIVVGVIGGAETVVPGMTVSSPEIVMIPSGLGVVLVQTIVLGMRLLIPPVAEKFPLM